MLKENLKTVLDQIKNGNNLGEPITLVGATKTMSVERINQAIEYGLKVVAENRVQEFNLKHDKIVGATQHFIGHLQTNKVKYIIDKVDMIESLSSINLAKEIDKRAANHGIKMPVLIEINIGREPQKDGVFPESLSEFLKELSSFENIIPQGLMTIAPVCNNSENYAPYFREMVRLRDEIFAKYFPSENTPILSMGMSGNFSEALKFDTNFVRIGTGIFGPRTYMTKFDAQK